MVLVILALAVPIAALAASGTAASLEDVQVTIQTSQSLPYQYSLTAYNSSGTQVASFDGNYPEASFGLPSGTYLLTASANYYQSYYCGLCPLAAGANGSGTAVPIRYMPPSSEYGYAVVQVSGPLQVSIVTKNSSDYQLVRMPVHVSFFNGTAATGASVSAYVVGMGYSYQPDMVAYGQTGSDGNFTLLMPDAPVQVDAYLSVPVILPKNVNTVVPVTVGGQKVNVTVYWQPYYLSLSGQALILPPQTGTDITLKYQQNSYPIYYSTPGQAGATTVTTVTSTVTGSAAQATTSGQSSNIAPFNPGSEQISKSGPPPTTPMASPYLIAGTVLAVTLGAGAAAFLVLGRKRLTSMDARP